MTFPLPLCGFGRLLLYRPFGLGIFKFLPHSCEVASGDELGTAGCHRFPTILCAVVGGEELGAAGCIAALPVSVRRGGMNDAW